MPAGGYVNTRVRTPDPDAVICPVFGPSETEPVTNLRLGSSYLAKEVVELVYKQGQMLSGLHVKVLSGTCEWEDGQREQLHYRFSWTSQPRQLTAAQGARSSLSPLSSATSYSLPALSASASPRCPGVADNICISALVTS